MPQLVRSYAGDQPVLEHPWKSVPRAAGYKDADAYILAKYPLLKTLPQRERVAAIKGVKRTLVPFLEQSGDGRKNPAFEEFKQRYREGMDVTRGFDAAMLADLYFHAQSPFRNASPEYRARMRKQLLSEMFKTINPEGLDAGLYSGEYDLYKILRPYLLLEIFEPGALSMEQRRTLNRTLKNSFYGFNGQMMMAGLSMNVQGGLLNKDVFSFNTLLYWSALIELQTARYRASEELWPGFPQDYAERLKDLATEIARNYCNMLMGDGATRYIPSCTHAYFYEGPQLLMLLTNYLYTYDEDDPRLMSANKALLEYMLGMGNYYEQTAFRVVEKDVDSLHSTSRTPMSEGKAFGNEIVNRDSDPGIHWILANVTGNRWLRQTGPAYIAQQQLENPNQILRYLPFAVLAAWNPAVTIGPDSATGPGFRQDYLLWDRNNLGATGKFGNWGFHFVGRGVQGRKANPEDKPISFFEKNTFAGFIARSNGAPPDEKGLRMDHQMAHLTWVGIFPESVQFWGSVKRAHPEGNGVAPGYTPHWQDGVWSSAQTDRFATIAASARADGTEVICRELWLATAHGAVGLLSGNVSTDPENGDGHARLSFSLQGFLGGKARYYWEREGFHVDDPDSPVSFPAITPDGNGFELLNLKVRVLEQNFRQGPIFAEVSKPEDFYPVDKDSAEMRGLFERRDADIKGGGFFSREVQVRRQFTENERPFALVAVRTGDAKTQIKGRRIALPGVRGEYLAMQVADGDSSYLAIFNPGSEALDLRSCLIESTEQVRAYRSGARFRPVFLDNVEVDPEADKEDEVVYGSILQNPKPQPLSEAIREVIPPHAHLVLVSGVEKINTGGPGFEVRPEVAQWRFRPENRSGSLTRELTGNASALSGGAAIGPDAMAVKADEVLSGEWLKMQDAGTVRFWVRPETYPGGTAWLLASGGVEGLELGWSADGLWARKGGRTCRFAGNLEVGIWQPVVFRYASEDPATWSLRVHDVERQALPGNVSAPVGPQTLTLGLHLAAAFKDLSVHDAVLTPGELNCLVDREQPDNYNRVVFKGVPTVKQSVADVFVNGNRLTKASTADYDTNKLTRHLKPGENVIGLEMQYIPMRGFSEVSAELWIHGRKMKNAHWEVVETEMDDVGSWILQSQVAHINRQQAYIQKLKAEGKPAFVLNHPGWRTPAYDRLWTIGADTLPWQPMEVVDGEVTWSPTPVQGSRLYLMRCRFTLE